MVSDARLPFRPRLSRVVGSFAAATAYARATGGVVFDGEAGEVLTPDKAAEIARDVELQLGKT